MSICALPLLLWLLNSLIVDGYLGSSVQEIYENESDASGIFWTDVEILSQD
ncbi:hypothetical protein [Moorena sp. SIO4G3]|uniref:hypothetical protein n=1 Tax=Moorena sp. SIO4G3 TaxID=2607821 RepID=UPI001429DE69|nr:hypothetical protein [Moorena sp. SIO4G3]NEO78768.1 hypothetical protein [Moorena sp. SIO4G3]